MWFPRAHVSETAASLGPAGPSLADPERRDREPRSRRFSRWALAACGFQLAILAAFFASGGFAAQRSGRQVAPVGNAPAGQFWTMSTPLDDGRQMLIVLDQLSRCLAIYHIDPVAGTVQLKSTRDLTWDLLIEEFNAQEPRPSSLKKMAEMPK